MISTQSRHIWRLPGGVRPPENKQRSLAFEIKPAGIPEELALWLSQHIGAPSKLCVSAGERVLKGQPVALARGALSANLHAPTSGHVVGVQTRPLPHPSGTEGPCLIIAPDGEDKWQRQPARAQWRGLDRAELLRRVRDAGVIGMGGAGFPTEFKLGSARKSIETLIINGTECEPYITADDALMRERAEEVVEGADVLRTIVDAKRVLIGIEENKPQAIAAMSRALDGHPFEIVDFPTKYPSGGEKQLIYILTGREVPSGGLPADVGVVCQNVDTTASVGRAVALQRPVISRITTVTGSAVRAPQNYETLIGTSFEYLLERSGARAEEVARLVHGGPMMGFEIHHASTPVSKTSNCLLAISAEEALDASAQQPCIRCGLCAQACPASLLPQQLYWFAKSKQLEQLERHNLFDCIECGACAYVCPSNIPLVQYYRASKAKIRNQREQQRKSDTAKERFEFHQQRIEHQQRTRAEQRERRKAAAKKAQQAGGEDAVQAAMERVRRAQRAEKLPATPANPQEGDELQ